MSPETASLGHVYRGADWASGPARVYDLLARELLASCDIALDGALTLDIGGGTGAVARAAGERGARVVSVDVAVDMLRHDRARRPPAVAGDACALPLRDGCVDLAVGAFLLNHLPDPAAALAEMRRVLRPGGCAVAATFAEGDRDDVKLAVDAVLAQHGYTPPGWYRLLKEDLEPASASPLRLTVAARSAALVEVSVRSIEVALDALGPADLVAYRLGMPAPAAFLAGLTESRRSVIRDEAINAVARLERPHITRMLALSSRRAA